MDPAIDYTTELVARERSGHTAVVEGSSVYVWGGYVSIAEDEVFLPNDEIWLYDLLSGKWQLFAMGGDVPPPMSGSCGCILNGVMYIFGGCDDNGQTNEHYCVNLLDGEFAWRKITHQSGSPPSARDKLSCWVYQDRLIYFGGYGPKLLGEINNSRSFITDEASWIEDVFWGWNNEVHIFDPDSNIWTELQTFGRSPAPRAAHASATLRNKGYVFGGRVMETRTNDIHCLDLETWTWTEIVASGPAPLGRSWHTITAVSETSFFLFGGLSVDCKPMSDCWLFDTDTKQWGELDHPNKDNPRLWHTACLGRDSDVIVFGGSRDYILLVDTGHCNDALIFQTQPYTLMRLCEDYIARNASVFKPKLHCLPKQLCHAVQNRAMFFRTESNIQRL